MGSANSGRRTGKLGRQYGFLLVIGVAGHGHNGKILYRCKCLYCGKEVLRNSGSLITGTASCCGCIPTNKVKTVFDKEWPKMKADAVLKEAEARAEKQKMSLQEQQESEWLEKWQNREMGDTKTGSLCWRCIRSAAPPSLQCIWDRSKAKKLPEGAEFKPLYNHLGLTTIVTKCPEYLSIFDKENIILLERERRKNKRMMGGEQECD